jgi:uncharacterized cupredoxin-like copper-binding protein
MTQHVQPIPSGAMPRWGRALAASAVALAVLGALAGVWLATRSTPSYARGPGQIVVSGTDYAFSPSRVTWRVGERVTLTFENDSEGRPGKPHELMLGRRPVLEETAFGVRPAGGYEVDFFEGVDVRLTHARQLTMLMPGDAYVSGASMGAMPGMEMAGVGGHGGENGFMILVEPGGTATISFTVPDKPGRWQLACFQQSGQHYSNGMTGSVTVERA